MRFFKKWIIFNLILLISFSSLAFISLSYYFNNKFYSNLDNDIRDNIAGTIDTLAVGSSTTNNAFNCDTVDDNLQVCSYNLSSTCLTYPGLKFFLEEELDRNPVKTVFLEFSFFSFVGESRSLQGDEMVMPRLRKANAKRDYFFWNFDLTYNSQLFGKLCYNGVTSFLNDSLNLQLFQNHKVVKGQLLSKANDVSLKGKEIVSEYEKYDTSTTFSSELENSFFGIVDLCKSKEIDVVLINYPVSDSLVWSYKVEQYDSLYYQLKEIAKKCNCDFYDFTLYKPLSSNLKDESDFLDMGHLSSSGAIKLSKALSDVIIARNAGSDSSEMFYQDYSERKGSSVYMEYYLSHINDSE